METLSTRGHFIIRTDHHILKYLLEQRVTTALQQKGLTKLLGLDYEVQYKKGTGNRVTDALSRRLEDDSSLNTITSVEPTWIQHIIHNYEHEPTTIQLITELITIPGNRLGYTLQKSIIRFEHKIFVGRATNLRNRIFELLHQLPLGAILGNKGLTKKLVWYFFGLIRRMTFISGWLSVMFVKE